MKNICPEAQRIIANRRTQSKFLGKVLGVGYDTVFKHHIANIVKEGFDETTGMVNETTAEKIKQMVYTAGFNMQSIRSYAVRYANILHFRMPRKVGEVIVKDCNISIHTFGEVAIRILNIKGSIYLVLYDVAKAINSKAFYTMPHYKAQFYNNHVDKIKLYETSPVLQIISVEGMNQISMPRNKMLNTFRNWITNYVLPQVKEEPVKTKVESTPKLIQACTDSFAYLKDQVFGEAHSLAPMGLKVAAEELNTIENTSTEELLRELLLRFKSGDPESENYLIRKVN